LQERKSLLKNTESPILTISKSDVSTLAKLYGDSVPASSEAPSEISPGQTVSGPRGAHVVSGERWPMLDLEKMNTPNLPLPGIEDCSGTAKPARFTQFVPSRGAVKARTGLKSSLLGQHPINFKAIVKKLKSENSSDGFRQLRDLLLEKYNEIKFEFGAVNVINLAIACDRHAMFAEVAASKVKEKDDQTAYERLQDYLHGKTDLFTSSPKVKEALESGADLFPDERTEEDRELEVDEVGHPD